MNPASIAVESFKTATGKQTVSQTVAYLFIAIVIEAFLKKESHNMDEFVYIPEGYTLIVFLMAIAFAFIAPIVVAMYFKNESKNAGKPWTPMYITTVVIDMFITPSLGLIAMSLLVQEFMPNIDPYMYIALLPIVFIIVAYLALKAMNEGFKAVWEQVRGVNKEVADIVEDIKQQQQ